MEGLVTTLIQRTLQLMLAVNYVQSSVRVFSFLLTGSNFVCLQIEIHVDASLFYFFFLKRLLHNSSAVFFFFFLIN